jgi:D-alanyl-D-alanine carboxypeptidase
MGSRYSARRCGPGLWLACLGILLVSALAGCASPQRAGRPAAQPQNYAAPGPPGDPWGPYIAEAAARFSVPEAWIREVMRQESGGRQYMGGSLTTSSQGAMGLMQVMPGTYEELRVRYGLDSDPYHPYNNILAGTAYVREMYDRYGFPAFLAAYNAGPRRLEEQLYGGRPLPGETVAYVAAVAPRLGASPESWQALTSYSVASSEATAELNRNALAAMTGSTTGTTMASTTVARATTAETATAPPVVMASAAMPDISADETDGTADLLNRAVLAREASGSATAASYDSGRRIAAPSSGGASAAAWSVAAMPATPPVTTISAADTPATSFGRTTLSTTARAPAPLALTPVATTPIAPPPAAVRPAVARSIAAAPVAGGDSGIQIGAFSNPAQARMAAGDARMRSGGLLDGTEIAVSAVTQASGAVLYRARLVGLSPDTAGAACGRLAGQGFACMVLPSGTLS